jgi:hypothetical protein
MKRFNPCAAPEGIPGQVYEITGTGLVPVPPEPEPTPAEIAERQARRDAQMHEYQQAQARRELLFTQHYGQPGAPNVIVPHGMMAVCLSVKFDNSDIQTDYFDRHASLSPDFVLLVVKKQAETERLARKALAIAFPEGNSGLDWKWHTEKYSMGHGNYLESSGFELPDELKNLQVGYRSGGVTHGHWEIEFTRSSQLLPHRHLAVRPPAVRPLAKSHVGEVALSINAEKHGLELRFPNIPAELIRAELKTSGWRWSRFGGCWYIKDTPERRTSAEALVARLNQPAIVPSPAPATIEPQPSAPPTWRQRFGQRVTSSL